MACGGRPDLAAATEYAALSEREVVGHTKEDVLIALALMLLDDQVDIFLGDVEVSRRGFEAAFPFDSAKIQASLRRDWLRTWRSSWRVAVWFRLTHSQHFGDQRWRGMRRYFVDEPLNPRGLKVVLAA